MTTPEPQTGSLPVSLPDVRAAAAAIAGAVVSTPTTVSQTLSDITGARVWLKFENLQFTASFKERGALNFLLALPDAARARGVVAASAGNHAQGVAYHAHRLGIPATIVMPADTPFTKITRTEVHEAEVVLAGDDFAGALTAAPRSRPTPARRSSPRSTTPMIIAGQGTVGLEILDAVPDVDTIVVPVGGGGLVSGIAVATKALRPGDRHRRRAGRGLHGHGARARPRTAPQPGPTIAEGIAVTTRACSRARSSRALVDDLLVVTEQHIEAAVALAAEIEKTVVEGAGAAGLAALVEHPGTLPRPQRRSSCSRAATSTCACCRRCCCGRWRARAGSCASPSKSPTGPACSPRSRR